MKTSIISLKAIVLLVIVSISSLNSSIVKAQCGFSLGALDATGVLTFSASPGTMDTEKVLITNTSSTQLKIYVQILNIITFDFRDLDSERTILPGASALVSFRFEPAKTATDSSIALGYIIDQNSQCIDSFLLVGHLKPNHCLETVHAISYKDPVVIGAVAEHEFHLTNQSGADIHITDVILQDSVTTGLRITSPLPMIVPKHSSDKILTYTFAPLSDFSGNYFSTTFATIDLTGDSVGCKSVTVLLIGNVAKPGGGNGIDTNLRPLFPSETRTLAITGTGKQNRSNLFLRII